MKYNLQWRLIFAGVLLLAPVHAELTSQDHARTSRLSGWGVATSPDRDCQFFTADGALLIHVPGGPRPHDLAAEIGVVNAPRVLQKVKGDFSVQVQVDGRFTPGSESMLSGRTAYNGAGLVVVFNEANVVTLARAVLQRTNGGPMPYANFEIRTNGSVERLGVETETPVALDKPLFLRLERRGQKINGAVSSDGIEWNVLEPKQLPSTWPRDLQVGVVAISTSREEFNPRFSKLRLQK
jgi:regulation of enolase protein 1 (concanavalin A-like superfamily)